MINVGVTLPNSGAAASTAAILDAAEKAERYGFHSVWLGEHVALPESYASVERSIYYEPHTVLSMVAGRTSRVRLGYSVTPTPYRHPLLMAKMLATLDQLSGGRVIYGGGVGHLKGEFEALGLNFDRRAAITDEYLQVMKLAWTEDLITFHGEFVDCTSIRSEPKPIQKPHPPIWLGGDSDGAFRRIARYAEGWHGLLGGSNGARREEPTMENFVKRVQRLRQIAGDEGREPSSDQGLAEGVLQDRLGESGRTAISRNRRENYRGHPAGGGRRRGTSRVGKPGGG